MFQDKSVTIVDLPTKVEAIVFGFPAIGHIDPFATWEQRSGGDDVACGIGGTGVQKIGHARLEEHLFVRGEAACGGPGRSLGIRALKHTREGGDGGIRIKIGGTDKHASGISVVIGVIDRKELYFDAIEAVLVEQVGKSSPLFKIFQLKTKFKYCTGGERTGWKGVRSVQDLLLTS